MSSIINVKVDPKVKRQAHKVAEKLGISLSAAINMYLRQLISSETIYATTHQEKPSKRLLAAIREAKEDRKHGRLRSFDNVENALAHLDTLKKKKK